MTRPHASIEESQQRGRAKQTGRDRSVDRFDCGHDRNAVNTIERYGNDICRQCHQHRPGQGDEPKPLKFGVGARFGMLVITRRLKRGRVECLCDCGNVKNVCAGNLEKHFVVSCGCVRGTHRMPEQECFLAKVW